MVRRANCGLQHTAGFCVARTRAFRCARSLWGGGAARALHVRARRAARDAVASCTIQDYCTSERPLPLSTRPCCVRASRGLQPLPRGAHVSAPLRSLSFGKRRSTRAYRARAPCRAEPSRSVHHVRPLHQREASLLRLQDRLRRASRGLKCAAGFRVARMRARHCARCLSGRRRSTRACDARAPCRAGCGRPIALCKGTALARGLSPSAQGRGATCQLRPPRTAGFRVDARERATALALSREEAQHASLRRARRAALVVVGPCSIEGHCTSERPLFFGARPCCDVPAAASNTQPVCACTRSAPLRSLSLGRRRSTRACDARAPCRAGCSRSDAYGRHCTEREASLLRRKAVLRRASRGLHTAAGLRVQRASAPLRSLSLGRRRSTRACDARAPRRAGCSSLRTMEGHCCSERPLSFGARPWCDVPCGLQHSARLCVCSARARHCARSLLGGGAARALATRARRAALEHCRFMLYERTLHEREASLLRRKAVLATCQPLVLT